MAQIVTSRTYNQGDSYKIVCTCKNGYGMNYGLISGNGSNVIDEVITNIGNECAGSLNKQLYPGAQITATLEDISVGYDITVEDLVKRLRYKVGFSGGDDPDDPSIHIAIETPVSYTQANPYYWVSTPYVMPVPTGPTIGGEPVTDLVFVRWSDGYNTYNAGDTVFINDDMNFTAQWARVPISVSVLSDDDNTETPQFPNP